ncbi:hypothetical protein [Hyalangium versicolor]|uniref:hypothetical protein n=1 Tax=Hyalangium versicolor TaxID=2861190 RepID=UPI001CC9FA95|nr:hypothetical protein [Hyalangium versicolor]
MAPSDNEFFDKAKTLTPLRSGPQPVTGMIPSAGASVDLVSKMSNMEKLRRTVEYALALPTLSVEIKRALGEFLNPENLAIAAGVMVVWAAAHFFGVGEMVDVILVGVTYATLGVQGMRGLADLVEFGHDVINAESDFDLRRAANKLARAFVALGVEVVMALLLRKAQIKPAGAKDAPSLRGQVLKTDVPPSTPVTGGGRPGLPAQPEMRHPMTEGSRSRSPLTEDEMASARAYAEKLGMPADKIKQDTPTSWGEAFGEERLYIGNDLKPTPATGKSLSANQRVSERGAIAHEVVGHREASMLGRSQTPRDYEAWKALSPAEQHRLTQLEEAQASLRAAKFAPDLEKSERKILFKDAMERLDKIGMGVDDVPKLNLFLENRVPTKP